VDEAGNVVVQEAAEDKDAAAGQEAAVEEEGEEEDEQEEEGEEGGEESEEGEEAEEGEESGSGDEGWEAADAEEAPRRVGKVAREPQPQAPGKQRRPQQGRALGPPEARGKAGAPHKGKAARRRGPLLQTLVFSATLTLPDALRKRLRRGGGGSSGAATLEGLMERIAFRGEPAVVDLTTQRKLADRVEEAVIECLGALRGACARGWGASTPRPGGRGAEGGGGRGAVFGTWPRAPEASQ
jgi:hypothetical protein